MKKLLVYQLCKKIAPGFNLDPIVVLAYGMQESKKADKDPDEWRSDVCRPEPDYYRRYIERLHYATTTEGLLSMSYGIFQLMGESLRELGWIKKEFETQTPQYRQFFGDSNQLNPDGLPEPEMSEINVPKAFNRYCSKPEEQVNSACVWISRIRKRVGDDLTAIALGWNGGGRPAYATEWVAKFNLLKKELS
jgi:hypothetical protein